MRLTRRQVILICAIVVVAFAIRIAFLVSWDQRNFYGKLSLEQGAVALSLLDGHGIAMGDSCVEALYALSGERSRVLDPEEVQCPEDDTYTPWVHHMPGYAFFLALVWAPTGHQSFIIAQAVQVIIDSLLVLAIFYASYRWFGKTVAFLASGSYAIYLPQAFLSAAPIRDAWWGFTVVGVLFFLARYPATTSIWRRYLAIGVVVGVGVYMTSAVVFLPLFIGIADSVVNGIRRSMAPILLSMVIVSIFLTPWAVRNFIEPEVDPKIRTGG